MPSSGGCSCFGSGPNSDAIAVEPRLEALDRDGVVVAVPQVILARPGELHRRAFHCLRDERRLDDVVGLGFAAEAAAEQRDVHRYALERKTEALGDAIARRLRRLRRRPDLAVLAGDARRRGRRLHRSLRHVRDVVLGLEPPRRARHAGLDGAEVADHLAGAARGLFQCDPVSGRIVRCVRAVVPTDLQRLAALDRRPGVAGDHRNPAERLELRGRRRARDLDHLDDARDLHRGAGVVGDERAAIDRRAGDDGVQHALEHGVDAVLAAAGDDIGAVDQLHLALADVAEISGLFQPQRRARRHRKVRSGGRQRPVAELALRRPVHHLVVERLHFRHGNLPLRSRGLLQHGACRGATAAHRLVEVAHAARAVGVLVAVARFVALRLAHAHAFPIGFELVGDHHRQAGAHALSHLLAVAGDRHRAVFSDGDEGQRVVHPAVRHRIGAVFRRAASARARVAAHDEDQAGCAHRAEKGSPADVNHFHFLIAARMRG
jgi:hypothetical protein